MAYALNEITKRAKLLCFVFIAQHNSVLANMMHTCT